MDMLRGKEIAEANLTDWRKLAQGIHARYLVETSTLACGSSPRWAKRATC